MKPKVGRPRVTERSGFNKRFVGVLESLSGKRISKRQASFQMGIGHATLLRLLEQVGRGDLVERKNIKYGR